MPKYLIFLLSFFISVFFLYVFINFDNPYTIDLNRIKKYNIKIDADLERKLKSELYAKIENRIESIILGSSRATIIDANRISNNSFNFAFSGAQLKEILFVIENEINLNKVNEIYLGLDEFMFDYTSKYLSNDIDYFNDKYFLKNIKYIFSYDLLKERIENNYSQKRVNYIYDIFGNKIRKFHSIPTKKSIERYLKQRKIEISKGYHKFDVSQVDILNKIVLFCKQHQIKLNIFINPISKELRDFYKLNNSDYEKYLLYMNHIDYVNFNDDNFVTENIYKYYKDPHHYHKEVGNLIIDFFQHKNTKNTFGKHHEHI